MTNSNVEIKLDKINAAIAAAKARKAAREERGDGEPERTTPAKKEKKVKVPKEKPEKAPKVPKVPKVSDEERLAKKELLLAERAERKAARERARAGAALLKPVKVTMSKLDRARAKLTPLTSEQEVLVNDIITMHSRGSIDTIISHLQHYTRSIATDTAKNTKIDVGTLVTITGGDPKWIGRTGTIERAQRIRCYVAVDDVAKPVYCFISDVTPLAEFIVDSPSTTDEVEETIDEVEESIAAVG